MITKKEFRELDIDKQVELVNEELSKAKGTKNFGTFDLDFSYGFARTILTKENYDTLDEKLIDGIKVKLFRKMNENELKEKEVKEIKKKEEVIEENNISNQTKIAKDMYEKNIEIDTNKKTISKTIPIFEDTFEEFQSLINSNEFKLYEKKYIIELMLRNFINTYK